MGEKIEILIKSLSDGALIGYAFGGWTTMLTLLLILVVLDWLTGGQLLGLVEN
nr:phage holin family protein [Paenibacillus sp. MER 78]